MPGFNAGAIGDPSGLPLEQKPFYTYTWELASLGGFSPNKFLPLISLRECTLPAFAFGKEEVQGASLNYKYASDVTWDDVRLTFYDMPRKGVLLQPILEGWSAEVWNCAAGIGYASDYKNDTKITVFNADKTAEYDWTMYGSWPSTIRDGELSYTTSDIKIVEVIVTYDWAVNTNVVVNGELVF